MASIFSFRSRSPSRDRETDLSRYDRLARLLEQISAEIDSEQLGLEGRYKAASTNAAFLVEAMENDSASPRSSARVDQLTTSILNCERRIAMLAQQASVIKQLRQSLEALSDGIHASDPENDETASTALFSRR